MIKKRAVILLILVIFLCSSVIAADLEIKSERVDSKVFPGGKALYSVIVKNNQVRNDLVRLYIDPFSAKPFSEFIDSVKISPRSMEIASGKEGTFDVVVEYAKDIKPERSYSTEIIAKSAFNEKIKTVHRLTSFIMSSGHIIDMDVTAPGEIIPGKETSIQVVFKNNVNEDLDDMDFYIISGTFNKHEIISIKKNDLMSKRFIINLKPENPSGKQPLILRLFKDGSLKGEKEIDIVVRLHQDIIERTNKDKGFLSSKVVITKINNGNVNIKKTVKYPIGIFQNLFTESSPRGTYLNENGERVLSWNINLVAGQQIDITIETDYSSLFFAIVSLILLVGLIYFVRNRSLRITKRIIKASGRFDKPKLKVVLNIQNNTNKNIENMKVVDLLPLLVKNYSEFGTLKPSSVQQGSLGLKFTWDIKTLYAGEERVISYNIEPSSNVFGSVNLPAASIQYAGKDNKLVIRRSNMPGTNLKN